MREFEKTLDSYNDVATKLEQALKDTIPDLDRRVAAIEAVIGDLVTIKTRLTNLESNVYKLDLREQEDVKYLQSQITDLKNKVDKWNKDIEDITTYFNMQLDRIEGNFNQQIRDLTVLVNTINEKLSGEISDLREKLEYILKNLSYDVYNPAIGERITFDENDKVMYVDLNDLGASCGDLAARGILVDTFASNGWRNREIFTKGARLITHSDMNLHSPLTGMWNSWSQALSGVLCELLDTITCEALATDAHDCDYFKDFTIVEILKTF